MCGQTDVVQNPISCLPQLQVFPVDSVSKAAKNVPLHCLVHSAAQWNVLCEEDFQHHLVLWSVSTESLFLWWSRALSVQWLPLSLWVIKVTPHFIACDYSVQNVQARVHHVDKITNECSSFIQLVFSEIFWNHVVTYMTHVQITMEQFAAGSIWHTYLFSNSISLTRAMVLSLHEVSGLPLRLPTANNTCPALNHRYHS